MVITTCPRKGGGYLDQTLASLRGSDFPIVVTDDIEGRGSRWNTWRALNLGAGYDRMLLLQDDVIATPELLPRAATMEIPDDVGLVSFHDFGDDFNWGPVPDGVHKFAAHRFGSIGLCGAQALLIPGHHARWLAAQDRDACAKDGPHCADYALGWWTARSSRPCKLIVSPALVRHVGERSACWSEERAEVGVGIPHAGRTIDDLLPKEPSP